MICVLPANCDLIVHYPLKIAFDFNPRQNKILACLTKIDLMDRGDSAKAFLKNEEIYMNHGYVGVKNRSQTDLSEGKSISECLQDEKRFFTNHL